MLMRFGEAIIAKTAEQGSRPLLWAALGPDGKDGEHVEEIKGAFVLNAAVRESSDFVISAEGKVAQDKAWVSQVVVFHRRYARAHG